MPSGRHGLWDHGGASRPRPLPRRRVALPRTNLTVKRDGLTVRILSSWYGPKCGQVFWLPDHCPSPAFPSAPLRFGGGAQWRAMEKDFPVTAARPRRGYTGLPFTLTLGRRIPRTANVFL